MGEDEAVHAHHHRERDRLGDAERLDVQVRGLLVRLANSCTHPQSRWDMESEWSFQMLIGAPADHIINVREVRLSAGAEFVVAICGEILTMPGLPKVPSADSIDVKDGKIVGLFLRPFRIRKTVKRARENRAFLHPGGARMLSSERVQISLKFFVFFDTVLVQRVFATFR